MCGSTRTGLFRDTWNHPSSREWKAFAKRSRCSRSKRTQRFRINRATTLAAFGTLRNSEPLGASHERTRWSVCSGEGTCSRTSQSVMTLKAPPWKLASSRVLATNVAAGQRARPRSTIHLDGSRPVACQPACCAKQTKVPLAHPRSRRRAGVGQKAVTSARCFSAPSRRFSYSSSYTQSACVAYTSASVALSGILHEHTALRASNDWQVPAPETGRAKVDPIRPGYLLFCHAMVVVVEAQGTDSHSRQRQYGSGLV